MAKTVPISVRISHEDAEFIANLKVDNAVTPSDKIRSIIEDSRKHKQREISYEGCLKNAAEALQALTQSIKSAEKEQKQHSELVNGFNDWITESFAYISAANHEIKEGRIDIHQLEEGINERVFRLFEIIARMAVTSTAPCYDKQIMTKGFTTLLELTQIINQRLEKERKNG